MARMNINSPGSIAYTILGIMLVAAMLQATIPGLNTSLSHLIGNVTGLPLGTLFAQNGIIVLGLLVSVVVGIFGWLGFSKGRK